MLHRRIYPAGTRFFALPADDEDVKIFPGSGFVGAKKAEDDGAAEFVRERDNGNLEKAKKAGAKMARKLRFLWRPGDSANLHAQKKVLFAYAAAKAIEKHCHTSVLTQSVLSEFHHAVKGHSQRDYDLIQDSVAFTKYLLSERGGKEALGGVFAELCDGKENDKLRCKGVLLYYRYFSDCLMILTKSSFQ